MKSATYRDLAWDSLVRIVRDAAEAADLREGLEAALGQLRIKFDAAVDAAPSVARALDRVPKAPIPAVREPDEQEADVSSIDPINRADDIAAHISDTFRKR